MDPQILMMLLSLISTIHTNQSNRQLAEEQRNWSEQMQDKENEYNLPENQMNRLREAGISPMAMQMGKGFDVSGNTSAPVTPYQAPQMLDPMSIASNSLLSLMSADKARAEAKTEDSTREAVLANIKDEGEKLRREIALLGLDARSQEIANSWLDLRYEVATMKDLSEIGLNVENAKLISSETETNLYKLHEVLPKEVQILIDKHELNILDQKAVIAAIKKTYTEIENIQSDTALNKDQLVSNAVERGQTKQQMEYLSKQISMYEDTYEDVVQQVANQTKLTNRQVKSFWINMVLHGAQVGSQNASQSAAALGLLLKGVAAM